MLSMIASSIAAAVMLAFVTDVHAQSWPPIPTYNADDYCQKLTALMGDNSVIRDSCLATEADARLDLDRLWPLTPPKVKGECIHMMELSGPHTYATLKGCLGIAVGNYWLRGDLKIVPAQP